MDQLTHRDRADFNFKITGPLNVATNAYNSRASIILSPKSRVVCAAHRDNVLHVAKGLDVVHDRRAHVETEHRREVGRLDPRIRALAFERFNQARFLAADVGAGAAVDVNLDVEPGAEHVAPEEISLSRILDGALENLRALGELTADVDVGCLCTERETRDQDSLDQLVRVLVNNVAVLESPRLRFIGVADQVDRFFFVGLDEAPLYAAGKTRAAAAAQAGRLHFVHDLHARHPDRLFQLLVAAVSEIAIDVRRVIAAPDVFENKAMLERVGRGNVI